MDGKFGGRGVDRTTKKISLFNIEEILINIISVTLYPN